MLSSASVTGPHVYSGSGSHFPPIPLPVSLCESLFTSAALMDWKPCPGLQLGRWVRGRGQSEGEVNRTQTFSFRYIYLFSNIGGNIIVITLWIETSKDIPQVGVFFLGKAKESPIWLFRRRESMWGRC